MKDIKYFSYFAGALVTIFFISVLIVQYESSNEDYFVPNNIQEVTNTKLLSMAAQMNTPEWTDALIEVAEWGAVAGVTYFSYGVLTNVAIATKLLRNAKKAKDITTATKISYTLLNKTIKPFYKAAARSFNKMAIQRVKKTPGVYVFFNKKGKVKYVGKAMNLRLRLSQHLIGPSNSGNLLLSQNAKNLSFITIPIKAIGDKGDAIKCIEAIAINAFNNGDLYNKRIEKINKSDCKQLIRR